MQNTKATSYLQGVIAIQLHMAVSVRMLAFFSKLLVNKLALRQKDMAHYLMPLVQCVRFQLVKTFAPGNGVNVQRPKIHIALR